MTIKISRFVMTRMLLILFHLIFSLSLLQGQYDSLYQLPFNERFEAFRNHVYPFTLRKDSLAYKQKIKELSDFSKSKDDKSFSLEIDLIILEKSTDVSNPDHEILGKTFQKLNSRADRVKDQRLKALVSYYTGSYYWNRKKDYSLAIHYFEKAYSFSKMMNDEDFFFKQQVLYNLGEKYFFLTDYSNTIQFLNESARVNNPWKPYHPKIRLYNTKGLAHKAMGQMDSAEYCFIKALSVAKIVNAKAWIGNLSGNLGGIYIHKGNMEKGLELLEIDKNISLDRNSKQSASGALIELSRLNLLNGNIEKSIQQLDSSLQLSSGKIPYPRKKVLYQLLSDIQKNKGNFEAAILYLDSALIVRDSLAKQDSDLRTVRLKQRIELEESRFEVSEVAAENKRKTNLLYGVIIGLFLALGGGFLLFKQKKKTDAAKKLSDKLLLNILPVDIATELKATGKAKAKRFQNVTVLFSDFKSFTGFAENLSPEDLVNILDEYFRKFDNIMEECGLEKIKTIGDAYMCVCGLPHPDPLHAEKVVQAAIQMQEAVKESPHGWQIRIGIHSGPLVAGIVGHKKFAYDVWGDTVNVAARMAQNSEQGKINISKKTYLLIKEKFSCTPRGKVIAKNKGAMEMYFVD